MKIDRFDYLADLSRQNYDDIAQSFSLSRRKHLWPEMEKAATLVSDGDSVLDLGCGDGRFLRALYGKRITYLGADNSSQMIAQAKASYPAADFLEAEATDLSDIADDSFDIVASFAMWHHLPGREKQEKCLREIARVLKPGGRLLMTVWRLGSYRKLRKGIFLSRLKNLLYLRFSSWNDFVFPWKGSDGKIDSLRYYHSFSRREIARRFKRSGICLEKMEVSGGNYWIEAAKK